MSKLSTQQSVAIVVITALILVSGQFLAAKSVYSKPSKNRSSSPPITVATAIAPPKLVPAVLGGNPIQVLYMTQSADTVLVRCYPGYEPTITV